MAITSRPQDKFAFLFTGPTLPNFLADLQNVFAALTQYYNYPAANVTVVLGSTPAVMPSFPGATVTTIASIAALDTALTSCAGAASGPASGMPGFSTTALLYFTGGGDNSTGPATLLTDGGSPSATNTVDAAWLTPRLNAFTDCHVDVVMQQSFAGGFLTALTGSTSSQWSFTHACGPTETSYGTVPNGGFFTFGWTKGLKYEVLPPGTPNAGQYADTLGSAGEGTNNLISLEEAKEFGKQVHDPDTGGLATPGYSAFGGAQYLGLPAFLIRDSPPFAWWESPDIYLTHPNHPAAPAGDLYIPDAMGASAPFNNTITVDVRNVGTHPVRRYSLGIELFKTGVGPMTEQHTVSDKVPAGGLLLPIDSADIGTASDQKDTTGWNTAFTVGTTHECVKAEAKLLSTDVDFSWSIEANDFEGQRNTDEMPMPPMPPIPPSPSPMQDIQGMKQHVYGLHNRFDEPRRFAVLFPPDFDKLRDKVDLAWFPQTAGRDSENDPLEVVQEPWPHLLLTLKAGEKREILLRARMKRGFKSKEEVRLPFAIVVEGEWPENRREVWTEGWTAAGREEWGGLNRLNFAAIAGFTVVIRQAAATLKGTVVDRDNKPIARAQVFLRTMDGLQGAVLTTDDQGRFAFVDVNPDVYRVRAEAGTWRSSEQTLVLGEDTHERLDLRVTEDAAAGWTRVKVILDRIRILRDHDPLLKGKGELVFTSVVVPDGDEAAKQVMRLPGNGVYSIGDKAGENDLQLAVTLFDGLVRNGSLAITLGGREMDLFDPDDDLKRYHRVFSGKPEAWFGNYQPTDEYLDREDLGDWALWYRIVRA
jgi:hypothetical protein